MMLISSIAFQRLVACKNRRRYNSDQASQSLEVIQVIFSFASLVAPLLVAHLLVAILVEVLQPRSQRRALLVDLWFIRSWFLTALSIFKFWLMFFSCCPNFTTFNEKFPEFQHFLTEKQNLNLLDSQFSWDFATKLSYLLNFQKRVFEKSEICLKNIRKNVLVDVEKELLWT